MSRPHLSVSLIVSWMVVALVSLTVWGQPQPQPQPQPVAPSVELISNWIAQLGDPNYRVRDRAQQRLSRAGRVVVPYLLRVLATTEDAEVVHRAQSVLSSVGEDFLLLCAHLSDTNQRIRGYAEEALAMRLLTGSEPSYDEREYYRRYEAGMRGRPGGTLTNQRPPLGDSFTNTAHILFTRLGQFVPVVVLPSAYEQPGFFSTPVKLGRAQMTNVDTMLREAGQQVGLAFAELNLGSEAVIVVAAATEWQGVQATERLVALALCKAVLHDIREAREMGWLALGSFYANREPALRLLLESARNTENPCFDGLIAAVALSGEPMGRLFPDFPASVFEALCKAMENGPWRSRQAAARGLASFLPNAYAVVETNPDQEMMVRRRGPVVVVPSQSTDPDAKDGVVSEELKTALLQHVLPKLSTMLSSTNLQTRYLALWLTGGLRPLFKADATLAAPFIASLEKSLEDKNTDLVRQALQSLAHLASTPPVGLERALELGLTTTDPDLREATMTFLRTAQTPALNAELLKRYTAQAKKEPRVFLATLLGQARDPQTLAGLLDVLAEETDGDCTTLLVGAFAKVTEEGLWPKIEVLCKHQKREVRTIGRRLLTTTALPNRLDKVRNWLEAETDTGRQIEWQMALYVLGDTSRLDALTKAVIGDDEAIAREAAIGLGESLTDEGLRVLSEACESEKEITKLAALHGLDALGRACAETGNTDKLNQAYRLLFNFHRDNSRNVKNLAEKVRQNFSYGATSYRVRAQRVRIEGSGATPQVRRNVLESVPRRPKFLDEAPK